jgi:hypothetical protein
MPFPLAPRRRKSRRRRESWRSSAAVRLLKFANRLRFDLPDALPRHREDLADFFEGIGVTIRQAVPQANDLSLAVVQAFHCVFNAALQ